MPVEVASILVPKNGNTFPLVEDKYFKGGYRVCVDVAARDALHVDCLKDGMLVHTLSDSKHWRRNGAAWTEEPFAAQGPVGPTGAQGNDGAQGPQGNAGPSGPTGPTGTGRQGPQGPTCPAGATGVQGPVCPTCNSGPVGPTGAASTVAGPTGPTGPQGAA